MPTQNRAGFPEFDPTDTEMDFLDDIEPEVVDGPFGLPFVKPKGAPEPPLPGDGR